MVPWKADPNSDGAVVVIGWDNSEGNHVTDYLWCHIPLISSVLTSTMPLFSVQTVLHRGCQCKLGDWGDVETMKLYVYSRYWMLQGEFMRQWLLVSVNCKISSMERDIWLTPKKALYIFVLKFSTFFVLFFLRKKSTFFQFCSMSYSVESRICVSQRQSNSSPPCSHGNSPSHAPVKAAFQVPPALPLLSYSAVIKNILKVCGTLESPGKY